MDDPDLCCTVCEEQYSNDRLPRNLQCGHSFCDECLRQILQLDKKCPECRRPITVKALDEIPINYTVLRLARSFAQLKTQAAKRVGSSAPIAESPADGERCKAHGSVLFFMCMRCNVWVCRDCLVVDHPDPPRGHCRIVSTKDALQEMKNSCMESLAGCVQEAEEFKKELNDSSTIYIASEAFCENRIHELESELLQAQNDQRQCQQQLKTIDSRAEELRELRSTLELSLDAIRQAATITAIKTAHEMMVDCRAAFRNLKLKHMSEGPLNTKSLSHIVSSSKAVYAVTGGDGVEQWSHVTSKNGHLYIYSLRQGRPPKGGVIVPYDCVRKMVQEESPCVFLEVGWHGKMQGIVHVQIFGNTARGRQTVFLCSGEKGPSYRNTVFYEALFNYKGLYDLLRGGDYERNDGSGGKAIVEGITSGGPYVHEYVEGLWVSWPASEHWRLGSFDISLKAVPGKVDHSAHGIVTSGLEVLKKAARVKPITNASVMDCGLIIPM